MATSKGSIWDGLDDEQRELFQISPSGVLPWLAGKHSHDLIFDVPIQTSIEYVFIRGGLGVVQIAMLKSTTLFTLW